MQYHRELVLPAYLLVVGGVGEVGDLCIGWKGEVGPFSKCLLLFKHDLSGIQVPHFVEVEDGLCSNPGIGFIPIWPGTLKSVVLT